MTSYFASMPLRLSASRMMSSDSCAACIWRANHAACARAALVAGAGPAGSVCAKAALLLASRQASTTHPTMYIRQAPLRRCGVGQGTPVVPVCAVFVVGVRLLDHAVPLAADRVCRAIITVIGAQCWSVQRLRRFPMRPTVLAALLALALPSLALAQA